MPDLLLELFSEEIPARMQRRAGEDLRRLVTDALVEHGFLYEGARAFATPRRLALHIAGLPAKGKDVREERRGPRVGAPEAALQGFLKSAGLASIEEARIETDPKKGEFYVAVIERPGRPTPEVLGEILPGIVRSFPWPKSMRWGAASRDPGSLRWVRPLHSILCTFGPETEEPEVVAFAVDGIRSGDVTRGHRFMAPEPIRVRRLDDYVTALERAKVVLDADRRRDIIRGDAQNLAFALGLELVEDEALLEEVAGLVEWPVPLVGGFDETFLEIPPEVIRATIRANQKCFVLRAPTSPSPLAGEGRKGRRHEKSLAGATSSDAAQAFPSPLRGGAGVGVGRSERGEPDVGSAGPTTLHSSPGRSTPATPTPDPSPQGGGERLLANRFILVSNLEATDGGEKIVAGNERVVRARLSDAKFFWETDQKPLPGFSGSTLKPLDQRLERLRALNIVFHEKLGTQGERIDRIAALAKELAPVVGADPELAQRAAVLAKADLVTEMVGEFPELQGLMGGYYAAAQGEHPSVAAAIEEHYKPLGPSDRVPTDPVSVAVALADKIDTLVGFWAIDEKPTGSKDPYALRRAALGVIRLVLENGLRLALISTLARAELRIVRQFGRKEVLGFYPRYLGMAELMGGDEDRSKLFEMLFDPVEGLAGKTRADEVRSVVSDLLSFFADRLKVYLREKGARHDLIDAVFSAGTYGGHAEERPQAESRSTQSFETQASPAPQDGEGGSGAQAPANDDLLMIVRRVEALGRFLDTEDGKNLLAGYKRAANILRIEEKKDGRSYDETPDPVLIEGQGLPEEKALSDALNAATAQARDSIAGEDFEGAMRALAQLRPAVDAFFDKVTVNADDPALRENRLRLLNQFRRATREVADFSKIEG